MLTRHPTHFDMQTRCHIEKNWEFGKLILFSFNFTIFIIIQHLYRILIIIYNVQVGSVQSQQNDRIASQNVFFFSNSKSCSDIFRVSNILHAEVVFHGIRTFHHIIFITFVMYPILEFHLNFSK